jgi:hypothetical protein
MTEDHDGRLRVSHSVHAAPLLFEMCVARPVQGQRESAEDETQAVWRTMGSSLTVGGFS